MLRGTDATAVAQPRQTTFALLGIQPDGTVQESNEAWRVSGYACAGDLKEDVLTILGDRGRVCSWQRVERAEVEIEFTMAAVGDVLAVDDFTSVDSVDSVELLIRACLRCANVITFYPISSFSLV
jgi:hypothetical protein